MASPPSLVTPRRSPQRSLTALTATSDPRAPHSDAGGSSSAGYLPQRTSL
jgi:hypothetical protein